MSTTPGSQAQTLDWQAAREFFARRLRARLRFTRPEDLEDLAQECLVRLLRATQREAVQNLEALMTTIASRVSVDWIRSPDARRRHDPLETGEGGELPLAAPGERDTTRLERLRFVVLEHFRAVSAPCLELAESFFLDLDWERVAERTGRSHPAIRKQWSRCYEALKREERDDPGFLGQFLDCLE